MTEQRPLAGEPREGRKSETDDPAAFLAPTYFMNFDDPSVRAFAESRADGAEGDVAKAVALFYAVRDEIHYNPYSTEIDAACYRASHTLEIKVGWCVTKGILMAASARALGIPARPGYANVRNHLATERFLRLMNTDIFSYHGYVELWLDERWVKATPVFNIELCEKFNVAPQEFDGAHDALFQEYDHDGRRHMEYLVDHGTYDDPPLAEILADFEWRYADFMAALRKGLVGDFLAEAAAQGKSA